MEHVRSVVLLLLCNGETVQLSIISPVIYFVGRLSCRGQWNLSERVSGTLSRTVLFSCPVVQIWSPRHRPQWELFTSFCGLFFFLFVSSKRFLPWLCPTISPTAFWGNTEVVGCGFPEVSHDWQDATDICEWWITVSIIFYELTDAQFIINKCFFFGKSFLLKHLWSLQWTTSSKLYSEEHQQHIQQI